MDHFNAKSLQENLLEWFEANARPLPWRNRPSLYGTWVSEIMLQQTTVAAVIPYWEKFMHQFPNVHALAGASEAEVLASWSGLGYYRRARNLHKAARMVQEDMGGKLPTSRRQWQTLPGVGAYASGAIASIALGEAVPAVDANARRVLSRWFFDDPIMAGNLRPAQLEKMGGQLVVPQQPGKWNEAVMELGATVCRAAAASCEKCPVLDQCKAGLAGVALQIPPSKKSEPAMVIALATLVVRRGDQVLLLPPDHKEALPLAGSWALGRKDTSGLHQGLWNLPASPWYAGNNSTGSALEDGEFILTWLEKRLHLSKTEIACSRLRMASFTHSITKYHLEIRTWEVLLSNDWSWDNSDQPMCGQFMSLPHLLPVSKLVTKSLEMFNQGNV